MSTKKRCTKQWHLFGEGEFCPLNFLHTNFSITIKLEKYVEDNAFNNYGVMLRERGGVKGGSAGGGK